LHLYFPEVYCFKKGKFDHELKILQTVSLN
jgi:hypothetical protein